MNTFKNKVAVITGGNSGIGLATAKELSRRGANVVISGRDEKTLAERNNSDAPLYFLCLQYRADSVIQGGTLDGQRVEGKPTWQN